MRASFRISSLLVALAAALPACGDAGAPSTEHGTTDTGVDEGTGGSNGAGGAATTSSATGGGGEGGNPGVPYPAPHPGMPVIPNHGGDVLHDPVIATVTFGADPLQGKIEQFGQEIGGLTWWPTVNAPYGVGPATAATPTNITDALPASMMDTDVETWLAAKIEDGTLPAATDQMLYALYYPASTTISISPDAGGGTSCQDFLGYHSSINVMVNGASTQVAYAVINRCGDLNQVTETASHEFTEAATDPHPLTNGVAYAILGSNAWTTAGGENADMCSMVSGVEEAGWTLTRVWNNDNAKVGDQPCLPLPPGSDAMPYFNAAIKKGTLTAKAGTTVTTEIDCYSFGPLPNPMTITPQAFGKSLTFSLDKSTCRNGDKLTLSITVAASATPGKDRHYSLLAQVDQDNAHLWRGLVHVN